MSERVRSILKNLNYTVSANFIVLFVYAILYLIVPKFLDLENYGLWQLYILYSGYVGFFHLGWLDGIYLAIAGKEYRELDKQKLGTQFWYFLFFQCILSLFCIIFVSFFFKDKNLKVILCLTAISIIIVNCKQFVLFILQSTSRIKEYAQLSRTDRYIYVTVLIIYLLNFKSYLGVVILDLLSKLIMTIWGLYLIRDILFIKIKTFKSIFPDIINNIKSGSNLMFSNIASFLITGVTRVFVERVWDIKTFGQLSLVLSISNMVLTFVNSVGVVMFPLLRKTNAKQLPVLYLNLRNLFVPFTFSLLTMYLPTKVILQIWLPQYYQSVVYMGILFPMIIFESRMALLVMTYLKTIRQERKILFSNLTALLFTIVFTFYSTIIEKSLSLTLIFLLVSIMIRCIIAEVLLVKELKINISYDLLQETILVAVFIFSNYYIDTNSGHIIYPIIFCFYIFFIRKKIKKSIYFFNYIIKNHN
ncbi:lipopolysaccharide biosynthesis protein [Enterococcus faecium]|uniref:lipopolysaccharide biosynthesis protein n=1 Tax=Enterococcus faecium TaxID=1352 RepID=UPI00391B2096